jgi:hypothetical protein
MIPFTNLCSYRLVFSKNLMKIGGLRAPFFYLISFYYHERTPIKRIKITIINAQKLSSVYNLKIA